MNESSQDIKEFQHLFNKIKKPIVCVKCSDEFSAGKQTNLCKIIQESM